MVRRATGARAFEPEGAHPLSFSYSITFLENFVEVVDILHVLDPGHPFHFSDTGRIAHPKTDTVPELFFGVLLFDKQNFVRLFGARDPATGSLPTG